MEKPSIIDIIARFKELKTFDLHIAGGCECCGSWIEYEETKHGDWVRSSDIKSLVEELEEWFNNKIKE